MKLLVPLLLLGQSLCAQSFTDSSGFRFATIQIPQNLHKATYQKTPWKLNSNKIITGGLVMLAGATKGFNETLNFHYKTFQQKFPKANPGWFNPEKSWKNKYKNGSQINGPKYPLSTTLLIMGTDQYHLNNFIIRASWSTAMIIKIGEKRKPWKYYLKDLIYYSFCHQLGFAACYYPFCSSAAKH